MANGIARVIALGLSIGLVAAAAGAQSTTATVSGRVTDSQGLALPGVTVTATSPNLQGTRETTTVDSGDYIISLLPPGTYTISFELQGFATHQRIVNLAPTQVLPVDTSLGLGTLAERVEVVGRTADVLTETAQVGMNFNGDLIAGLATNRDINTALHLAPSVHSTGPTGAFSIAGSMSFENLFMVNGVTVNENVRGQASVNLVIEDAIQETTVASAGISAEYGRFGGGVMNVITRSGGNRFSGSFRDTLYNDDWRALVPKRTGDTFANDSKIDKVVPTYEYTAGGPVARDRVWFFTAGRLQKQESNRQLVVTNIPYVFTDDLQRYENKVTVSPIDNHRIQGAYTRLRRSQSNASSFNFAAIMDEASLENRSLPEDLFVLNYSAPLSSSFFLEALYSFRNLTFIGAGSQFTDEIKGTLLVTPEGRRYWSPTFCGVCTDEERDNNNLFVKGTWFKTTGNSGSHSVTFGYDWFNDIRRADNYQSGSDYRIQSAPAYLNQADGVLYPRFNPGSTRITWNPIFLETQGGTFVTHALFVNDSWRVNKRLTANLGLRWDKNDGTDQTGTVVATDGAFSPRVGFVLDATGDGLWTVSASVAKYVAGIASTVADLTSPAGNADTYVFNYTGPAINADANLDGVPDGPLVPTDQALAQLFAWFDANGRENLPIFGTPTVKGVSPQVLGSLRPPSNWEYAAGVSRQVGDRAALRADFIYRNFQDFYVQRTDLSTGRATDTRPFAPAAVRGREYDLSVIENDEEGALKRRYAGLTLQGTYRFSGRTQVGGNYTLSRTWGNVDGENLGGPITDVRFQYPEYRQASWNYPDGDLSTDQRHRMRVWLTYGVPKIDGLDVSVLQLLESGVPYSASNQNTTFNGANPAGFITNPGYLNPPSAGNIQYYYTARDAFRTEGQKRTDLAVNYNYAVSIGSGRALDLFIQAQIVNLWNQFDLCACGNSVFLNGGNVQNNFIGTTVRNAIAGTPNPGAPPYQSFNPFTTTPVLGTHWDYGTDFGKATSRFAYTTPRMFRLSFGVRF